MDLSTKYLGLTLKNPLVPSASPLSADLDNMKRMEDAGAGAIVMHSLFEEQLSKESAELHEHMVQGTDSFAEALSYFPEPEEFRLGPEDYLDHIRRAKKSLSIPVIASLNGTSLGGWVNYAKEIEKAGADALELNIYYIPTEMDLSGAEVEKIYCNILKSVKSATKIPVAVKLSPFFSNLANVAKRLDDLGANALVLFNRFYQPDIDLETLEVKPRVLFSRPQAMRLPLRWVAILHGRLKADLAATSGIHTASDCIKMLMVGAKVTMLCSVLLAKGIDEIKEIDKGMRKWLQENEYDSISQLIGSMSQKNCPDPSAFERAQYIKALQGYKLS